MNRGDNDIIKYNKKGEIIYFKHGDFEYWRDFDDDGNMIRYRDNKGYVTQYDYDEEGNRVHFKNSKGYEEWVTYEYEDYEIAN